MGGQPSWFGLVGGTLPPATIRYQVAVIESGFGWMSRQQLTWDEWQEEEQVEHVCRQATPDDGQEEDFCARIEMGSLVCFGA